MPLKVEDWINLTLLSMICYIMRYSIEPRDRIYIFPLQKIMNKSLSIKYGQMLLDNFKTASERDI